MLSRIIPMYDFERDFSYFIRKEVFVRKDPYITPVQVVNKVRPLGNNIRGRLLVTSLWNKERILRLLILVVVAKQILQTEVSLWSKSGRQSGFPAPFKRVKIPDGMASITIANSLGVIGMPKV